MNQDHFAVILLLLPPALSAAARIAWRSGLFAGRTGVEYLLAAVYVVFGVVLQLALGWRYFRAEFWSVAALLALYNALICAGIIAERPRLRRGDRG